MATADKDIEKTLSQLIEKISQTDQLVQECNAEGARVLQDLKEAMEQLNASQEQLKKKFYEWLTTWFEPDDRNIHGCDFSRLQDEVLRVIGTEGKVESVGLMEGLQGFKKMIDEINERVIELSRDLKMVAIFCGIKESNKGKPFHFRLSQLIEKLSQTDQCLDQLVQECDAQGANVLQISRDTSEKLKENQEDLKEFRELLRAFSQSVHGNIPNLDISQLQDKVIETSKEQKESMGLVQDHERFTKSLVEINERVIELMRDYDIVPKSSGIEEKSEGVEGKENGVRSVSNVAMTMYGFPKHIAEDIENSVGRRKLIENEKQFDFDEASIRFEIEDLLQVKDPVELSWVIVKKLKQKFEELKRKIYERQKPDVHGEAEALGDGDEDPVETLLKVIRNWVFHIESVLFNSIVYELYYMLPETIFESHKAMMKALMEMNEGMVPIAVYKIIHMKKNPIEIKEHGAVRRTPTMSGSDRERLDELKKMLDQVEYTILRLHLVLATSDLSNPHIIEENDLASNQQLLKFAEERVREIQRKINLAKSEPEK